MERPAAETVAVPALFIGGGRSGAGLHPTDRAAEVVTGPTGR